MTKLAIALLGFMMLFLAFHAEAADFAAAEKGLPSLLMLSTPT